MTRPAPLRRSPEFNPGTTATRPAGRSNAFARWCDITLLLAAGFIVAGEVPSAAAPPLAPPPAVAESADAAAIRQRFEDWTAAVKGQRFADLCDLFVEDAIGETLDAPPRGRDRICDDLRRLGESARSYRYDLELREIAVFGDMAVVRPTWTLTVSGGGLPGPVTVREIGLDVLRRDPDGTWRVVRFLAAAEPRR